MIHSYTKYFFVFCAMILLFSSGACRKKSATVSTPSYIRISAITVTTDYATEGSNSSNIKDAWVYVDDFLVGAFELPAIVPVLYNGNHELSVRAGIKASGFNDLRISYSFYQPFRSNFYFYPDSVQPVSPQVVYYKNISFAWLEDFENVSAITLAPATGSQTGILVITDPASVFEGSRSASVTLTGNDTVFEIISDGGNSPFTLNGSTIFLELNYRCTNNFTVGLYANYSSAVVKTPVITLYPAETWNKIYIDLTGPVKNAYGATAFDVYFTGARSAQGNAAGFCFDNVKLIN